MYKQFGKHLFDIIFCLFGLLTILPLILLIALIVRFKLGSPILFTQQRPGKDGRPFTMAKFRSMTDATDAAGHLLPDAVRLTKFGRFLRSTSLDELPALYNVITGDMSLVGPRPLLMQYLERYTSEQMQRHEVKPGITGWAQVNGRNAISWEEKFEKDIWYVNNQSFMLDIHILWKTVTKVFHRQDISQPGQATAKEFMGSSCEIQTAQ